MGPWDGADIASVMGRGDPPRAPAFLHVCACIPEQVRSRLPPGVDGWGYSLKGMMGMVVVGGLLITGTYYLLQRTVVPTCAPPSTPIIIVET